jgi:hypothetical protein
MTVRDLISKLSKEDPDLPVVVEANEATYDLLESIREINIRKNKQQCYLIWDGEFCETENDEAGTQKALFLCRKMLY